MRTPATVAVLGALCLSACSATPVPPVVGACMKLAGTTPADAKSYHACTCIDTNARRQLDPASYKLLDDVARQVIADRAPASRGMSAALSVGRFVRSRGQIDAAIAGADFAVLSAKSARACIAA